MAKKSGKSGKSKANDDPLAEVSQLVAALEAQGGRASPAAITRAIEALEKAVAANRAAREQADAAIANLIPIDRRIFAGTGDAVASDDREKVLSSGSFRNCNLIVLKNVPSDPAQPSKAMMIHMYYNDDGKTYSDTVIDDLKAQGKVVEALKGLKPESQQALADFLKLPGKHYGISYYRPWQFKTHKQKNAGGDNDLEMTHFLRKEGVAMVREPIRYFVDNAPQSDDRALKQDLSTQEFDADYFLGDGRLRITIRPDGNLSRLSEEGRPSIILPETKPFEDIKKFELEAARQAKTAGRGKQ